MSETKIVPAPVDRNGHDDREDAPGAEVVPVLAHEPPVSWLTPTPLDPHRAVMRPLPLRPVPPSHQPIILERQVSRMNPFYLPRAKARTGLVLVTARAGARPVDLQGRRFASRELLWAGGTLYEVDTGLHHTSVQFDLPADGDTSTFRTTAAIEWRVTVPQQVVQDNLRDVREALAPLLQERLGRVTRKFGVGEIAEAEKAVADEMAREDPGAAYGLKTRVVLRLMADEKGAEHVATRRELEREIEIEDLRQQYRRKQEENEQEMLRTRLDLYRVIIASGDVEQFALRLARSPDDVRAVVELLHQERDEERTRVAEFVTHLLESGAVDRWDVEDQVREALRWLAQATRRAIRITDDPPEEPPVAHSNNGSAPGR